MAAARMTVFAVYGDWKSDLHALSDEAQRMVAEALAAVDADACVWVEAQTPDVLRLSVDIDAAGYDDALCVGRAALDEATGASHLPGRLLLVTASTEDGYAVWLADGDEQVPSAGNRRQPPSVKREYLPMSDDWDDHAPGTLTWLQAWYAMQCDGEWEHGYGVAIETLDNPGWSVRVELEGTDLAQRPLDRIETHRSEHDWVEVWKEGSEFHAATGPLNLGEALHAFRLWVEGPPALAE